jgi:hypothetical protein
MLISTKEYGLNESIQKPLVFVKDLLDELQNHDRKNQEFE